MKSKILLLEDSLETVAYYVDSYEIFKNNKNIQFKNVDTKKLVNKRFKMFLLGRYKTTYTYTKDGEASATHNISLAYNFYTEKRPLITPKMTYGMWGFIEDDNGNYEFDLKNGFQIASEITEQRYQKKINSTSYKVRNNKAVQKTSDVFDSIWFLIKFIIGASIVLWLMSSSCGLNC
tara:strand:+ start:311 stop:841 length:531 start_codon:yes stop_codon:yes gene_type:complete